ncbi:hypothetical protein ISN45_At02g007880 [Arabidopsis thaliana x Arabidopsis arenosa]|uniref:Uncharacterized protein n=1 Tax=Arabidopsis thaliana x Arabidopsis arenosa TaxID=1240361 RepID=A0A8T2FJC7_9BRAS|nr:hypothetical protein ISN45_At02g007880 [Arabidopsis thaliana x Arabidopsis arenosa]
MKRQNINGDASITWCSWPSIRGDRHTYSNGLNIGLKKSDLRLIALQVLNQKMGLGLKGENEPPKETRSTGEKPSFTLGCQVGEVMRRPSTKREVICSAGIISNE